MTSSSSAGRPATSPAVDGDRTYRSVPAAVSGVALLIVAVVMLVDALISSELRIALTVVAGVVAAAPLIVAFTLRPVVRADARRLLVRNPFRTITLPWSAVADFHAGYSCEVRAVGGRKYQLWSIPVSLRARRRASARQRRASMDDLTGRTPVHTAPGQDPNRSWADNALDELRSIRAEHAGQEAAQGEARVSWSWPIYLPLLVGVVALVVLNVTG